VIFLVYAPSENQKENEEEEKPKQILHTSVR